MGGPKKLALWFLQNKQDTDFLFIRNSLIKAVLACFPKGKLTTPFLLFIVLHFKLSWSLLRPLRSVRFWLWNFLTMKCYHNSGSNEQRPFFGKQQIFPEQRSNGIGMASVFDGEQANASPEFQPVFAIFQLPASLGKGRTFETFDGYSRDSITVTGCCTSWS